MFAAITAKATPKKLPKAPPKTPVQLKALDVTPSNETLEIEGTVLRVIYKAEDYHVLSVRVAPKQDVVVTGQFAGACVDDKMKFVGKWKNHPRFGIQFLMENYQLLLPSTEKGIKAFLGGGMIKGIGPKTAEKIVDYFGIATLDVIRKAPERLVEVPGIGPDKAEKIAASLEEYRATENIMIALQGFGVSSAYALKIYKHFGDRSVEVIQKAPYQLTDVKQIGFLIADQIAAKLGIGKNDPMRLQAGVLYVLDQASQKGHVCLPENKLIKDAVEILECNADIVSEVLEGMLADDGGRRFHRVDTRCVDGVNYFYLPYLYACEQGLSTRIEAICKSAFSGLEAKDAANLAWKTELALGLRFADEQRLAVETAIQNGVTIITGGPGTGKTTIIRAIVEIAEKLGRKVQLAAPTGRAAKRMSEATKRTAKTIHRLLEYGKNGESGGFKRNENNQLTGDVVIIDEASMLDVVLAYQLMRAVRNDASIIFVGDIDQLPSVGPGRVLHDIIDSGRVSTVRLAKVFRQAEQSLIVVNAHRINTGKLPLDKHPATGLEGTRADYFMLIEDDPEKLRDTIIDLVTRRLPSTYHLDPVQDIQILSPMRKGIIGVQALNEAMQESVNPKKPNQPELKYYQTKFRVHDKVMQIQNNYEKEVYNGEVGIITSIDSEDRIVTVAFDQLLVQYDETELDQLVQAYCCSIHKSQGSEYPAVVIPIHTQHFVMLQRNLLYTGLTRGKALAVLVGSKKALAMAVKNNSVPERFSHLKSLLSETPIVGEPIPEYVIERFLRYGA